jgi:hypothetical protein
MYLEIAWPPAGKYFFSPPRPNFFFAVAALKTVSLDSNDIVKSMSTRSRFIGKSRG